MSQQSLEARPGEDEPTDSAGDPSSGDVVAVGLGDDAARVDLPPDASDAEAAAIVAAVGAHVRDRERAAARAAAASDEPDLVDRWILADRLGDRRTGTGRVPRDVQRGDVWRAASRSL